MITAFLKRCSESPDRAALEFADMRVTYGDLASHAARLAWALTQAVRPTRPPFTAVLAERSLTAYAGFLGSRLAGQTFVPLNPTFPVRVLGGMLQISGARTVVVGQEGIAPLPELVEQCRDITTVILPESAEVPNSLSRFQERGGTAIIRRDLVPSSPLRPVTHPPDRPAYLMFTSGSTGAPKAVAVPDSAASAWLESMLARYDLRPDDRTSHITTLAFDCALLEILVPWSCGACVCVPNQSERLNLGSYIATRRLTVWVSSPATASLMRRLGSLEPGSFPTLRLSIFGSEGLPVDLAVARSRAAPNSLVDNVYGPTELTVCCTAYRFDPATIAELAENGLVPIGNPLPGMRGLVVDDELKPVAVGQNGELLMTGPQLAMGYWGAAEQTAAAFVVPPGETETFYRTRDCVRRSAPGQPMTFLGRLDDQFKIHGMRVEPAEVEAALRRVTGHDPVVAVGWPVGPSSAEGVVAFIEAESIDQNTTLRGLRAELPAHMVPRRLIALAELPRNPNGKVDRTALLAAAALPQG